MTSPEGYQPSPSEIEDAESHLDDRQRELSEIREETLDEGRKQGKETSRSEYPEVIQEAIELGRMTADVVELKSDQGDPKMGVWLENLTPSYGLPEVAQREIYDKVRVGDNITLVESANSEVIGIILNEKLIWEKQAS